MTWVLVVFAAVILLAAIAGVIAVWKLKDEVSAAQQKQIKAESESSRWQTLYHEEFDRSHRLDGALKEVQGYADALEKDLAGASASTPRELADRLRGSLSKAGL